MILDMEQTFEYSNGRCHVTTINAQGKISLRGGGDSAQRLRLEDEGVIFDERGRVNLKEYQWNGIPI